jgi:hypothetical protein
MLRMKLKKKKTIQNKKGNKTYKTKEWWWCPGKGKGKKN